MSNLEAEVRALIKAVEKLAEHNMHDRMFRQWSDGVLPAIERVRGAIDSGECRICIHRDWIEALGVSLACPLHGDTHA